MFDSIKEVETASLFIFCGLILFICSFTVLIVFLSYKELRHGIYGMIIGTVLSEVYLGLHSFLNGIYGLSGNESEVVNETYCKVEAAVTVFFWIFWSTQNISIMILFLNRKLKQSSMSKFLFFISITSSVSLATLFYLNDAVGQSYSGTCFITKKNDISTAMLCGLYICQFLFSIAFNIWFSCCRDTSKDRNFINGYNYFILITSFMWLFQSTHMMLICFFRINLEPLYYISLFTTRLCFVYIGICRLNIEYVQILFAKGPSDSKWLNCVFFMLGCYKKPRFKNIKKVLNVKYIESNDINGLDETIYSQMMRGEF